MSVHIASIAISNLGNYVISTSIGKSPNLTNFSVIDSRLKVAYDKFIELVKPFELNEANLVFSLYFEGQTK